MRNWPLAGWGSVAALAVALAFAIAGCGGSDDTPATTQVQLPPTTQVAPTPPTSTTTGGTPTHDGASAPGGDDRGGSQATTAPADPTGQAASPAEVRRVAAEREHQIEQVQRAIQRARDGDPSALERLREQMKPTADQRRQFRELLRQRCAEPAPPPICARFP